MAVSPDQIIPLSLAGIGLYLAWFGVHYWDSDTKWPSDPIKAVLTGKPIPKPTGQETSAQTAALVESMAPSGGTGTQTAAVISPTGGSSIASDAMRYVGQGYVWGGPADRPGNWDCSSFCNYVLGHDLGMTLPGGGHYGDSGYPPHTHGPTTIQYLMFGTPITYGKEQPGDLLVTTEHMGIVIGGGKMVSAESPQSGTGVGDYTSGFPGGQPFVRRVP